MNWNLILKQFLLDKNPLKETDCYTFDQLG